MTNKPMLVRNEAFDARLAEQNLTIQRYFETLAVMDMMRRLQIEGRLTRHWFGVPR